MNGSDTGFADDSLPQDVRRVTRRLASVGLDDRHAVWERFDQDGWTSAKLLADLNRNAPPQERPITRAELATAVAELVRLDVDQLATPRWPIYAAQIAFVVLLIALFRFYGPIAPVPAAPQLVAARDLPPYHVLLADDIRVVPATTENAGIEKQRQALAGHYTTRLIRRGSPLSADAHADGTGIPGLNERRIATLRVIPPDASLSAALPAHVALTASTAAPPAGCDDTWILSIVREGTASTALATVALPPACAGEPLSRLLAARAVTLVWDPPR